MARKKAAPEIFRPVYVRPNLPRAMREACRAFKEAAFTGKRGRPAAGDFDPLHLRMGMRAWAIEQRAGWVVSNPLYAETLDRVPSIDPSLPGPGWLQEVYRWRHTELVTLPGVRAHIAARMEACRQAEQPPKPAAPLPAQPDLFAA